MNFKLAILTYVQSHGLQLICLAYLCHIILSILFAARISCFSSGFLLNLILIHVPFVLLLLLFGIHYLSCQDFPTLASFKQALKTNYGQSSFHPPPLLDTCTSVRNAEFVFKWRTSLPIREVK